MLDYRSCEKVLFLIFLRTCRLSGVLALSLDNAYFKNDFKEESMEINLEQS